MNNKRSGAWKYAAVAVALFLSINVVNAQSPPSSKSLVSQKSEKKPDDAQNIINDLLKAKIISPDRNKDLSFKLNYDELIVNGRKISGELHDELRHKYLSGNPRKTISFKRESN